MDEQLRHELQSLVRASPTVDVVIVHLSNGDNEFFSYKPEVEACERETVVAACLAVIAGIRETEARQRRRNEPMGCPGTMSYTTSGRSGLSGKATAERRNCPA